jgi:hypothetical protein
MGELASTFPGWHFWRGRSGDQPKGWYATRRERITARQVERGLFRTLAADDADGLRDQLKQQATIENRVI